MPETAVDSASNGSTQNGQVAPQGNAEDQNGENPENRRSMFEVAKAFLMRALFMYLVITWFRKSPPAANNTQAAANTRTYPPAMNYFQNSTIMDLFVYLSEDEEFKDFKNPNALVWQKSDLVYGDWFNGPSGDGSYSFETTFTPSEKLKNNGSIFLHAYVVRRSGSGGKLTPPDKVQSEMSMVSSVKRLNRFKKSRFTRTQNLLTGETPLTPEEIEQAEKNNQAILSHWHPNITVNMVFDETAWVKGMVPSPLNEYIEFSPGGEFYKPVLFFNDFWNLLRDYQPINHTTESLTLQITYQPLSLFKWQMYAAHSMRNKFTTNMFGGEEQESDEDQDTLKETLLETSPYLLGATLAVSILHSIFELLAFKNDIQFWNNRKSLEGLSVRSVFFNVFQSAVVLLYVLDNDTNMLIIISCFMSLGIDIWKINKVVDISLDRENKLLGILPRIKLSDKGSYIESSTKEYDEMAFRYLSWVLFPLLAGYAVYSLIYLHHKGWYSWMLNVTYGFLLTFGFIMMTPQLFINYKLKSVAHMPWRMMSYKFLNTFIDDVFAFVIKVPFMYRLGCFRDDIVFIVFLYQRWIYKTDPKRLNEFGFSAEMENPAQENVQQEQLKSIEDKKED